MDFPRGAVRSHIAVPETADADLPVADVVAVPGPFPATIALPYELPKTLGNGDSLWAADSHKHKSLS
jgi:hypothetical protein